jgi:hypothetical protein
MNELKEYRLKEELKKQIDKEILESNLPIKSVIEMLEELINLYKN